jgi:hypothetical protein
VFAKDLIDKSLMVAAAALDLSPKPRENFFIEANSDTAFARDGNYGPSLRIPEIIFTLHRVLHIALRA